MVRAAELEVVVTADTSQATSDINAFSDNLHSILAGRILQDLGKGAISMVTDMVTSGAAFEQTMVRIKQLAGGTDALVNQLSQKAYAVDQATIYSAQQIAEAMEQLAREGATPENILGDWTDSTVNLAAVLNENLVTTANSFGVIMRIYTEEANNAAHVSDVTSQAVLRSGKSLSEYMTAFSYVGGTMEKLGISYDETATTISLMEAEGVKATTVGVSLRKLFQELATNVDAFTEAGITAFDPQTGAFVGMPALIDQFHQLLDGMKPEEQLAWLTDMFDVRAAEGLWKLFGGGTEAWDEHVKKMNSLGTASAFMGSLMETTAGSIDRMKASLDNMGRAIGILMGQALKPLFVLMANVFGAIGGAEPIILGLVGAFIALGGALAVVAGSFMIFNALGGFGLLMSMFGIMTVTALSLVAVFGLLAFAAYHFRDAIGDLADRIGGWLGVFGDFLDYLSDINQASGTWNDKLDKLPEPLRRTAHAVGTVVEAFADLWYFLSRGDFDRFMTRLPGELRQMATGFSAIGDEIAEAVGAIDWGNVLSTVFGTAGDIVWGIGKITLTALVELGGDLVGLAKGVWNWVLDKIYGKDSSGVGDILGGGSRENPGLARAADAAGGGRHNIPIGTVVVDGLVVLGENLLKVAGNVIGWVINKLAGGGDEVSNGAAYDSPIGALGGAGVGGTMTTERTYPIGTVFVDGEIALGPTLSNYAGRLMDWVAGKLGLGGSMEGSGLFDAQGDQIYAQAGAPYSIGTIIVDGIISLGAELLRLQANATSYLFELLGDISAEIRVKAKLSLDPTEGINDDARNMGQTIGGGIVPALMSGIASAFGGGGNNRGSDLGGGNAATNTANILMLPVTLQVAVSQFAAGLLIGLGKYMAQTFWTNMHTMTDPIMEWGGKAIEAVTSAVSWAFNGIKGGIKDMLTGGGGLATGIFDPVTGDQMLGEGVGIFDEIGQIIHDSLFGSIKRGIESFYSDDNPFYVFGTTLSGWMIDAFSSIADDIIGGLPPWAKKLIGGDIIGALRDLLGGGDGTQLPINDSPIGGLGGMQFGPSSSDNLPGSGTTTPAYRPPTRVGGPDYVNPPSGYISSTDYKDRPPEDAYIPASGTPGIASTDNGAGNPYGVTTLPNTGAGPGQGPMQIPPPDISMFTSVMMSLPQIVGQNMSQALGAASAYATGIGTVVGTAIGTMVGNVGALMGQFTNNVGQGMSNTLSAAAVYMTAIQTNIATGFATIVTAASDAMSQVVAAVQGGLANAAAGAYGAGVNIGASLAAGISSQIDSVRAAAAALSDAAQTTTVARNKIGSPSKVFMGYGRFIGQGMAMGMESMTHDIRLASRAMSDAAVPNAKQRVGSTRMQKSGGGGNHYYFAVTADDLAKLQADANAGRLHLSEATSELGFQLGI